MKLRKDIKNARTRRQIIANVWVITSSIACGKSTAARLLGGAVSADGCSAVVLRSKWRKVAHKVLGWRKLGRKKRLNASEFAEFKKALREEIFGANPANLKDAFGLESQNPANLKDAFLDGTNQKADSRISFLEQGSQGSLESQNPAKLKDAFSLESQNPPNLKDAFYKKKRLEKLLHFRIKKLILESVLKGARLVEIPLYFESRNYKHFINKLVIWASADEQIKRICARDNCIEEQARAILNTQLSADYKAARANWLIKNNGDLAELKKECEKFRKVNNV